MLSGNPLFRALAFSGFFLNLFDLAPICFLDGGRIVTALSRWLWLVGAAVMLAVPVLHPNFLVGVILVVSLPRLWSLFRKKSEAERRYFEVTPDCRLAMAVMYFGLIVLLLLGMSLTHVVPASDLEASQLHAVSRTTANTLLSCGNLEAGRPSLSADA